jgi:hypothetical protein
MFSFHTRIGLVPLLSGAWGGVVVKALRDYSDSPGIDSRWCHWIFHWHILSDRTMALGVDSAPSENEYHEYFLGVKAASAWGWQPHYFHVSNVMKSGSLNLLEPSGAHQASYGAALHFTSATFFFRNICVNFICHARIGLVPLLSGITSKLAPCY